jgi:outer membrane protein assembly factor BamB
MGLLCGLAGCSSIQGTLDDWFSKDRTKDGLPAELVKFDEKAAFKERWKQSVGDSGGNPLTPAITAEAVYAVDAKGELHRFARDGGTPSWRVNAGFAVSAGVGAGAGLLLVGGHKGELAAFDESGKVLWQARVSSEVMSAPQVAEGTVVVRTGDGRITALEASSGKVLWNYQRATPTLIVRSHAGLAIQRSTVFAGFAGGKLVALNLKNGAVTWEVAVSPPRGNTELERISDITSTPVADDEQVCAIAFQGRMGCYDIAQGGLLWSREIASERGLYLLRKYLYVTESGGSVMALDKSTGSTVWKNEQLNLRRVSAPAPQANWVIVGDLEGYLHAMSRDDGAFAARFKADGGAVLAAPVELDRGLLVQTRGGGLYSLVVQ